MRTKFIARIGAITVAIGLAGCSSSSGSDQAGDITLRMTMWSSDPGHLSLFEEIAEDFMAQNDAVSDIKFESLALDQLDTELTTSITAGDAPDLTWLPVESGKEYIAAEALLDVAPTLKEAGGYDFDDLVPALQERWREGDAQYGVPFSTGPIVMYYNKDLYEDAGVKSPGDLIADDDWTWESFREISKELKESADVPGYVVNDFDFKNWTRLVPLMYAYGASPWDDDAVNCTADTVEMKEAIGLFHGMVFEDRSSPLPRSEEHTSELQSRGHLVCRLLLEKK